MRDEEMRAGRIGRLTRRADFLAAATGGRFHSARMTAQGRLRPDGSGPRLGLTVTKRVGHATERNRIKRRLRAAALDAALPRADMPLDLVIVARREVLDAAYRDLVEDLRRAPGAVLRTSRPRADRHPSVPAGKRRGGSGGTPSR